MNYYVGYLDEDGEWQEDICFSFLIIGKNVPTTLTLKFINRINQANWNKCIPDWLLLMNDMGVDKYFEHIWWNEEYIYCTIDLKKHSLNLLITCLSILRYAGEYTCICWNTFEILKRKPGINVWEALFYAHQGTFKDYPFGRFYYNNEHAIFKQGNVWKEGTIEKAFKQLLSAPLWKEDEYNRISIHDIFNKMFGPYVQLEEVLCLD